MTSSSSVLVLTECKECGEEASESRVTTSYPIRQREELTIRGIDTEVTSSEQYYHIKLDCRNCVGYNSIIKSVTLN